MYRGFPVGQGMFWQTGAEPGVRQIGVGDKAVPVPYHLIVDGQQRLTSLYAVTTGKPVVREDFTAARIKIAFNPFTELFAVPDATTEKQVEWLADITPLFEDFLDTVEGYIERLEQVRGDLTKQERKHLFAVFDRVRDLIAYQFSVVELDATAEEEQVAEVFVRINSEGVVLNQADFILTLMSVFWEKGRRELEDFARAAKTPTLSQASPADHKGGHRRQRVGVIVVIIPLAELVGSKGLGCSCVWSVDRESRNLAAIFLPPGEEA